MHLFMKFILAPVLFVLSVFVIIQTYRKYKIKHLLKKWERQIEIMQRLITGGCLAREENSFTT